MTDSGPLRSLGGHGGAGCRTRWRSALAQRFPQKLLGEHVWVRLVAQQSEQVFLPFEVGTAVLAVGRPVDRNGGWSPTERRAPP